MPLPVPNAQKCFPVVSTWAYQAILMCDDSLAIQYKHDIHTHHKVRYGGVPGVVCWYPNTPLSFFDLIVVWQGPGEFVHKFLYKKWPYQIIANPCPPKGCGQQVACCPGLSIPNTLYVTLTSTLTCLNGSYPITWHNPTQSWVNQANLNLCGLSATMNLQCAGNNNWYLVWNLWSYSGSPPDSISCSPLSLQWKNKPIGVSGFGSGTVSVTITV